MAKPPTDWSRVRSVVPTLDLDPIDQVERGGELLAEADGLGMDGAIQDASYTDLEAMRTYLNNDLFAFAQFVFGFHDLIPSLHGDLAAWISDWGWCTLASGERKYFTDMLSSDVVVQDNRRIMTQIPREFFKSSIGTRANALWQVVREPHLPVAIFNEKADNAEKWLKGIRDVAQSSKLFQQVYKDLLPPGIHYRDRERGKTTPRTWKWSDSEIDFQGKRVGEVESSISAHGIESAAVGGHWPKLIFDDLISFKHRLSASEMERAREWFKGHIYLMRPAERSCAYINCTPWTYTDIYVDAVTKFNYRLYRRSALESPTGEADIAGESIFPQKLSTTQLRAMHTRDPFGFNSQMQCIPKPGASQSFDNKNLRPVVIETDEYGERWVVIPTDSYDPNQGRVEGEPPPPQRIPLHQLDKCIILDPAPSEPTQKRAEPNARSALLVAGMDCWDRKYLLEAWAAREDYATVIDQIFTLGTKWATDRLHVEEVNFSNVYRHWVAREQLPGGKYAGRSLRVLPLYPKGREKNARIMARQPETVAGQWYLVLDTTLPFQVEFSEYPNSSTVDLLDCFGYTPECLQRPLSPLEQAAVRRNQRNAPYSEGYYEQGRQGY